MILWYCKISLQRTFCLQRFPSLSFLPQPCRARPAPPGAAWRQCRPAVRARRSPLPAPRLRALRAEGGPGGAGGPGRGSVPAPGLPPCSAEAPGTAPQSCSPVLGHCCKAAAWRSVQELATCPEHQQAPRKVKQTNKQRNVSRNEPSDRLPYLALKINYYLFSSRRRAEKVLPAYPCSLWSHLLCQSTRCPWIPHFASEKTSFWAQRQVLDTALKLLIHPLWI